MLILMKVSSRDRADILLETVRQYAERAANLKDMVWLFSFDSDDTYTRSKEPDLLSILGRATFCYGSRSGKIGTINRDINEYPGPWDILLNVSDDQRPVVKGYDDLIRNAMPPDLDSSLWFNDGWQDRINTQEILGRNYYERFKYIYHPSYKSFFCDNESTEVARRLDKLKKMGKCIIRHDHPACTPNGLKVDDLYRHNDSFWSVDQYNYAERERAGFPK